MVIPQGCISLRQGERIIDLHNHLIHGINPGVGGLVAVEEHFVEHEGFLSKAHLYDPRSGDPVFDYSDPDVTLYDGCTPSRR